MTCKRPSSSSRKQRTLVTPLKTLLTLVRIINPTSTRLSCLATETTLSTSKSTGDAKKNDSVLARRPANKSGYEVTERVSPEVGVSGDISLLGERGNRTFTIDCQQRLELKGSFQGGTYADNADNTVHRKDASTHYKDLPSERTSILGYVSTCTERLYVTAHLVFERFKAAELLHI